MAEARAALLIRRLLGGASFAHGVHPPERKELTASLPIHRMPFPAEVVLPLRQHAGKPARCVMRKGQRVERGDVIGEADGWVSCPVHASAAGTVVDVDLWPHPDGSMQPAVRIAVDRWATQLPRPRLVPDFHGLTHEQVVEAVRQAGVVGLGGAAFPTHVKLSPPKDCTIDTVLLNGAECEPYLTTDHRLMVEQPERVHFGLRIMLHALGVKRAIIGIENNKPDAIEALQRTAPKDLDVTILGLEVKYPQGAEKMLIESVLGRRVASGKLPATAGVIVQNVGSVASIGEVFETGLPLVERVVTVSGHGVRKPANLLVPVGTKYTDLLAACGGLTDDAAEVIHGGPMMGVAQHSLDVPVLKGTSGVVVVTQSEIRDQQSYPCIHCGRCLEACPMFLDPSRLGELARAQRYEDMEALHLADCMLCGSCSFACPSNIPIAQLLAASKASLRRVKAGAA